MASLMLVNGLVFAGYIYMRSPGTMGQVLRVAKWRMVGGGIASFTAYALVVWAFTQAPIALVTALRETSIVFALLIGVFIFRERLDLAKVLSTFLTLGGAFLLRFGKLFG
jgi:drug/metabolite transporter (DMT)-like permease